MLGFAAYWIDRTQFKSYLNGSCMSLEIKNGGPGVDRRFINLLDSARSSCFSAPAKES